MTETKKECLWVTDLEDFKNLMGQKIGDNITEKGVSWRNQSESMSIFLMEKLREYYFAEKWVDVANICFMLWNRETTKKECETCISKLQYWNGCYLCGNPLGTPNGKCKVYHKKGEGLK